GLLADASVIERLDGTSAAERGLLFVPALAGLACPHWDRSAAGLFIGIDGGTTRDDMVKAVLEGVAFRLAEVLEALDPGNSSHAAISADGGLMRSRYFAQFLADVIGCPIADRSAIEVTALGAATLARAGAWGDDPGAVPLPIADKPRMINPRTLLPVAELRSRFAEARRRSAGWRK